MAPPKPAIDDGGRNETGDLDPVSKTEHPSSSLSLEDARRLCRQKILLQKLQAKPSRAKYQRKDDRSAGSAGSVGVESIEQVMRSIPERPRAKGTLAPPAQPRMQSRRPRFGAKRRPIPEVKPQMRPPVEPLTSVAPVIAGPARRGFRHFSTMEQDFFDTGEELAMAASEGVHDDVEEPSRPSWWRRLTRLADGH